MMTLMSLSPATTSITNNSKGSLYSSISFGFRSLWTAHNVPPPFLLRMASKTTMFSIMILPFLKQWVSWTVTIVAPGFITSFLRLSILPLTSPAQFVENTFTVRLETMSVEDFPSCLFILCLSKSLAFVFLLYFTLSILHLTLRGSNFFFGSSPDFSLLALAGSLSSGENSFVLSAKIYKFLF